MEFSIEKANKIAVDRMEEAQPFWVDVKYAYETFENFDKHTILHAGPPISFSDMCNPMKGGVIAALLYEGLASSEKEAIHLANSGKIKFCSCNDCNAVAPMAGIISYSMPLLVVKNQTHGNYAFTTIHEGEGKVARLGDYEEETISRLRWLENTLAPALKRYVDFVEKVNLKVIMAQALEMGDELHMRNVASSNFLLRRMIDGLINVIDNKKELKEVLSFMSHDSQFFLNLAMAAAKSTADAAHGVEGSTIVTTISRNGIEAGIKVSGLGNSWFTAPAEKVTGLYFLNYNEEDANLDIGDSAILETVGLGAMAIAASPLVVKFLGAGGNNEAIDLNKEMYEITFEESNSFRIPNLDLKGTPVGIDIVKVVETGIVPHITTAIAGRYPKSGMIGAGISKIPVKAFEKALIAYADQY